MLPDLDYDSTEHKNSGAVRDLLYGKTVNKDNIPVEALKEHRSYSHTSANSSSCSREGVE